VRWVRPSLQASEAAAANAGANEKRLTKLAATQLASLHEADEKAASLSAQLADAHAHLARAEGATRAERCALSVATREIAFLEGQLHTAGDKLHAELAEARRVAAVGTRACCADPTHECCRMLLLPRCR
jgi:hypothetical protein